MSAPAASGRLARNVVHFARILRRAGLPIGPGKVIDAVNAVAWVGIERRDDFRTALQAALVDRHEQCELFEQAFRLFWRDPGQSGPALRSLLPRAAGGLRVIDSKLAQRLAEALADRPGRKPPPAGEPHLELDAALSFSGREVLRRKDFEAMTLDELAEARRMLHAMHLPLPQLLSRRYRAQPAGRRLDVRATLRSSLKFGGEWVVQRKRERVLRPSALVALCDISGSMTRYSRMLLHYLHAVGCAHRAVHVFTFATRLTNITRALRHRDVDRALDEVTRRVPDWSGGTRIGAALGTFNRHWARRLLAQGALVLLVTDGLDRGEDVNGLRREMRRLHLSALQLVWLNPLLRFEDFEPRAAGILAMLPYVDSFLPAHNVASLTDLGRVLGRLPKQMVHRQT